MIKNVGTAVCIAFVSAGLVVWAAYLSRIDRGEIAKVAAAQASDKLAKMFASKIDSGAATTAAETSSFVRGSSEVGAAGTLEPPRTLYGYYGDLSKDGKTTDVSKETYSLQFGKTSPEVVGEVSGPVIVEDKRIQRRWAIRGIRRDPRMVLTILAIPSKDDPTAKGIGTYYVAKNGDDYTGTAIYLDCVHRVVECPYALSSEDVSPDQARGRWAELFNRKCEKRDLTPGLEQGSATC